MENGIERRRAVGSLLAAELHEWRPRTEQGPRVVGVLPGEGIGLKILEVAHSLLDLMGTHLSRPFEVLHGSALGLPVLTATGRVLRNDVCTFMNDVLRAEGAVLCGPPGGRFVCDPRRRQGLFTKLTPIEPWRVSRTSGRPRGR